MLSPTQNHLQFVTLPLSRRCRDFRSFFWSRSIAPLAFGDELLSENLVPNQIPPFFLNLLDSITYKRFQINQIPASLLKSVEPY